MPEFLEHKLQAEYGKHSPIPYKIMNKEGFMRGNKETAKGRLAEKKHRMAKHMDIHSNREATGTKHGTGKVSRPAF